MTIKCLITAGCSFSQVPNADVSWPAHLNEALIPEKIYYLGQGAAGNGIISRKIIYAVNDALKNYSSDEILVGVMWSGFDRKEIYSFKDLPTTKFNYGNEMRNPCAVIENPDYYILNRHWDDEVAKSYYSMISEEDLLLTSLEHMLRTQWFLKLNNIKYFMTQYDYDAFGPHYLTIKDRLGLIKQSKDLTLVYDQIDFTNWLPIENMYAYAKFESQYDFARPNDGHPSTEQHKEMVEKVLLPFLKNMYNIE